MSVHDLRTSGRAFATLATQAAADAWCQAAQRVARSIGRPCRTWAYRIGLIWYVNAVIADWPANAAERRALREWERRGEKDAGAVDGMPGTTPDRRR